LLGGSHRAFVSQRLGAMGMACPERIFKA
jgi:hypothetical protein